MWILSKILGSSRYSRLEDLVADRTTEVQSLSERLLKVRDEERRKIARDLHDTTGQTLTALKLSVSALVECRGEAARLAILSDVAQLTDQALEEIRTMSYLLHPPLLEEVGFPCAAERYIEGFAKRSGINIKAEIANPRSRLPKRIEVALFRVLQESLTNVHRHSGASEAIIRFRHEPKTVTLEIRDFGKGMSKERLQLLRGKNAETGVGLAGMRERLYELNGKLEIESEGRGTSMRATVPLYAPSLSSPLDNSGRASTHTAA